jgi:hypothetical protein
MDNVFILNHEASPTDLIDAIHDSITKAKAITATILHYATPNSECPQELMIGVLENLSQQLEEINFLHKTIEKNIINIAHKTCIKSCIE